MVMTVSIKEQSCFFLTSAQLKRINANCKWGIIYNIKLNKLFKGKFNQCKVVACENTNGNFFTGYYFYNMPNELKITKKIMSQLGKIRFN